jgi:hypothetical protein
VRSTPQSWAAVTAALVDAFDVVLCGLDHTPSAAQARRLQARARERAWTSGGGTSSSPWIGAGDRVCRAGLGEFRVGVAHLDAAARHAERDPERVRAMQKRLTEYAWDMAPSKYLIELAPDEGRNYGLSNWHESPSRAMQLVTRAYAAVLNSNAFVSVYNEFYARDDAAFRKAMVSLGYDVFLDYDRPRLLVWNPRVIDVVAETPYGSD